MRVRDFLSKCSDTIFIQIKNDTGYVNRGLAKDLLTMSDMEEDHVCRLDKEIKAIDTEIVSMHWSIGKSVADIIISI